MSDKKTPWFNGSVKPARPGVYERKYSNGVFYCYWDGSNWHMGTRKFNEAIKLPITICHSLPWRGLAQEPKS